MRVTISFFFSRDLLVHENILCFYIFLIWQYCEVLWNTEYHFSFLFIEVLKQEKGLIYSPRLLQKRKMRWKQVSGNSVIWKKKKHPVEPSCEFLEYQGFNVVKETLTCSLPAFGSVKRKIIILTLLFSTLYYRLVFSVLVGMACYWAWATCFSTRPPEFSTRSGGWWPLVGELERDDPQGPF